MKRIVASQDSWKPELIRRLDAEEIRTDSDIDDFIEEFHANAREVEDAVAAWNVQGTPCEGCRNAVYFPDMHPCCNCSRGKKDYYKA